MQKVHQWAKDNNFLKNQKFSLSGRFIAPINTAWEDIKLSPELTKTLRKVEKLINDTELQKTLDKYNLSYDNERY